MIVMEKRVIWLLIVTLASVMIAVDANCIDRDPTEANSTESTMDKVSNFFIEVGCTLRSGADKVKESVKNGYDYVKTKLDGLNTKNQTDTDTKPITAEQFSNYKDKITFREKDSIGLTTELTMITTTILPKLDDRIALTVPEMCQKGELKVDGKCRKQIKL